MIGKTELMNLDEFLFMHDGKSTAKKTTNKMTKKSPTSDLLSDLLQTVHKNLGVPRGSQPSAFRLVNEPVQPFKNNQVDTLEKTEKCCRPPVDHEYIVKQCKVEQESDDGEESYVEEVSIECAKEQKGKQRKPRTYKYNPKPVQQKSSRSFVPEYMKDNEYWEKRKRNNMAAKKSREDRRKKELEVVSKMAALKKENSELRARVKELEKKNMALERKLEK